MSLKSPLRWFFLSASAVSLLPAQDGRVVVDNLADLQACVNRPAGPALVCALKSSPRPYSVSGSPLEIRRSNTTLEGAAGPGEDPPTLRRTDPSLTKMIWVLRMASNVTIRNLQIDGNQAIATGNNVEDIFVDGSNVTVEHNHFGNSTWFGLYFGGPHFSAHDNIFGKLLERGASVRAPGDNCAIKAWGPGAHEFSIENNEISFGHGAISITDAPGGSDPATAGIISNNTLYQNFCVPNCGSGQIYVAGKTSNVKIMNNTINGGWAESNEREQAHSYGIEIDKASYIYSGSNKISNHSISGIWIGNGANHITIENDTVHDNGLNGVQIAAGSGLAPVSDVAIFGLTAEHNDRHRGPGAPYPTLPRFFGVMIQSGASPGAVCIQSDSRLGTNAAGGVYARSRAAYTRAPACQRPYN